MAVEKRWLSLPDNPLLTDGTVDGQITVANGINYRVGQDVILKSSTQTSKTLKIARIQGNSIFFRALGKIITSREDVSMFLVADSAVIFLFEQEKSNIPLDELTRSVYEEEPVVANRVVVVDNKGDIFSGTNPIPVNIISGGGGGGGGEPEPYLAYQLNEFEDLLNGTLYIGKSNPEGLWIVERIIETGGALSKKYANVSNNATRTTFTQGWTNRLTLTFTDFHNLTGI